MLLLCLDIGNTHILGGIYKKKKLLARFRYATNLIGTADQFGIFLCNFLNFHHLKKEEISATAVCSVVPSCDYTIRHTIKAYFDCTYFVLQAGVKTGLKIRYKNPSEVGADRIANAIGAISQFPDQNIVIIDMGTATTVCAITKERDYLGGAIIPGMRLGMESLKTHTAKLMEVDIEKPENYVGQTTKASIQAGLYYGQLGALKEIITGIKQSAFKNEKVLTLATGGFAQLYKNNNLFDIVLPDLVLQGLSQAYLFSL